MQSGSRGRQRLSKDGNLPDHQSKDISVVAQYELTCSSAPERPAFAFQVDQAISNSTASTSDLEAGPSYKEDDESWLEVSPDDVDALLAERSGRSTGMETGETGPTVEEMTEGDERGQALSDLAKKVESFVGGKGNVDGATFAE